MIPTTRSVPLLATVLLLPLVCVTAGCGCSSDTGRTSPTGQSADDGPKANGEAHAHAPTPDPLLDGWEKPALAIVLTGEQHGYLEPCGCSLTQSGGLARRADLFRQIEERGWPVTAFDLGGTLKRSRIQSQYKFQTLLAALKDMHYQGLGMGPEELRLGPAQLLASHVQNPEHPEKSLAFLGANVTFFGVPDLEGAPERLKIVEIGGVKVGVTSVLGTSFKNDIVPQGAESDITIESPEKVLPQVIEELDQAQPDVRILLSHASLSESQHLAAKFPGFDIVLSAGGAEDPSGEPQKIGETLLWTVGRKGKYAGVVGFYPDADERFRFELVNLDMHRFHESPRMHEHMQTYQDLLKEVQLAAEELPISHPTGATFVGAEKCGECHTKAYGVWKTTRHAHAFESLKIGRKGQEENWISRIYDPECLACHVTGWHSQDVLRYESGYISEEETPHLLGQQCENCHGPGSRHVELEWQWRENRGQVDRERLLGERKAMHLTKEIAKKQVCYRCHDLDNSPNFEFETYWEKVKHPFRD